MRCPVAVVGDITVDKVQQLAHKYFGSWRTTRSVPELLAHEHAMRDSKLQLASMAPVMQGPLAVTNASLQLDDESPPARTSSGRVPSAPSARPANLAESPRMVLPSQAGPAAHLCFYRPAADPAGDSVAIEMLADILSGSRSSRVYSELVLTGVCVVTMLCSCVVAALLGM